MPFVEELKITGNKIELIFQSMFKEELIPKDARNRKIGVKNS
jgi:hypothetical protein